MLLFIGRGGRVTNDWCIKGLEKKNKKGFMDDKKYHYQLMIWLNVNNIGKWGVCIVCSYNDPGI